MRIGINRLLLLVSFVSVSVWAATEDSALTLADLIGGKQQFNLFSHQVLNKMIRQQPELARYQPVVQKWGKENLTWAHMRTELAIAYHSHFTEPEIQQMILFFRTAAGQKYLRYSPLLQEETVTIGQRIAHEQQPKLLEMLQQARQNSSSSH
ncbi:MAG: DUF2059 domain-containing protein [Tolumonas sp.]|nr:DUF2059 domain-containing protein [Tolumonas sp.]